MERIAIMADSGCDLPEEMINKGNVRVLPLKILYEDGEYLDGVNIEPSMVYDAQFRRGDRCGGGAEGEGLQSDPRGLHLLRTVQHVAERLRGTERSGGH